jgi:hypothetical protein
MMLYPWLHTDFHFPYILLGVQDFGTVILCTIMSI